MSVLQVYTIGKGEPSAVDFYNLKEDAATVNGVAVISFTEAFIKPIELDRVLGFAEINDENNDLFAAIDAATAQGSAIVSALTLRAFIDAATVTGVAGMSYILGWSSPDGIDGSSSVASPALALESPDSATVTGSASISSSEDFITPANAYTAQGRAEILDYAQNRVWDVYSARDVATVIGDAEVTAVEFSRLLFGSSSSGISYLGSSEYTQFRLDEHSLDDPDRTLDARYVLNTSTPDAATVVGVAINKSPLDDSDTMIGVSIVDAQISEGYVRQSEVVGLAVVSAVDIIPTRYDFLAVPPPPFGQPGDGVVIGNAFTYEEAAPYMINSPAFASTFSTFRYEISAIERYNYSTAMLAASNGEANVTASMDIAMATDAIAGTSFVVLSELITVSSRYSGGFTVVAGTGVAPDSNPAHYTEIPTPSDGEYVYDTSMGLYYLWAAGTSKWIETNDPVGRYYYATGPTGPIGGQYS